METPTEENQIPRIPIIGVVPEAGNHICPLQPAISTPQLTRVADPKSMSVRLEQTGVAFHFMACQGHRCPLFQAIDFKEGEDKVISARCNHSIENNAFDVE